MTELADKIDALAEKATPGPWECLPEKGAENFANSIYAPLGAFDGLLLARVDQNGATNNAALIVELVNARETLTRAVRDAERMREALEKISAHRYDAGGAYEMCKIAREALGDTQ